MPIKQEIQKNNMTGLTDALISTISTMVKDSIDYKSTTIIEGFIDTEKDHSIGLYDINYMGIKFSATAINKDNQYAPAERVYILVPNGNMQNQKLILGSVSSTARKVNLAESNIDRYISYGDNLLLLENTSYTLSTFEDLKVNPGEAIQILNPSLVSRAFMSALMRTHDFDFSFKVKTNIVDITRRKNGDYGLYLKIPYTENGINKYTEIIFGISDMNGNPYNFMEFTTQHFYFTLPENVKEIDSNKIELRMFCYGFPKSNENILEENLPQDIEITNIKIEPVKLLKASDGYELNIAATGGSFFTNNIQGSSNKKTLIPNLYYQGKLINLKDSQQMYTCYWFIEDCTVKSSKDEGYLSIGGKGWRVLNEVKKGTDNEEEDNELKLYKNQINLDINKSQVHFELRYKCVITVNGIDEKDKLPIIDIITITNLDSDVYIDLKTDTGSNIYKANMGTVNLLMTYCEKGITYQKEQDDKEYAYLFYWRRFNKTGTEIDDFEDDEKESLDFITVNGNSAVQNQRSCSVEFIDQINTFECTIVLQTLRPEYDEEGHEIIDEDTGGLIYQEQNEIIGTRSISISTDNAINYNILLENDVCSYKYDWSGNSPLTGTYDGPTSTTDKTIKPIYIKEIRDKEGRLFTEEEMNAFTLEWYIPMENTMFDGPADQNGWTKNFRLKSNNRLYWYKKGNFKDLRSLNYTIKNQYSQSASKGDNTIILMAILPSIAKVGQDPPKEVKYINNIIFVKDGESGTNGTNYNGVITYGAGQEEAYEYGEIDPINNLPHKFQLVYIDDLTGEKDEETGLKKGEWFIYNPAWKKDESKLGDNENSLGLLHLTDNRSMDKKDWVKITYEVPDGKNEQGEIVTKQVTESIKPADDNDLEFQVEIYCSGEKVIFNEKLSLSASWSIFDNECKYDNIISPITILNGKISINPEIEDWGKVWRERNTTITATIQVKAAPQSNSSADDYDMSGAGGDSTFYLYAYYPIEVTYISKPSIIYTYIPSMVGGYDNVLYNRAGMEPRFAGAQENPFEILGIENIESLGEELKKLVPGDQNIADKEICDYTWTPSKNLFYTEEKPLNSLVLQPIEKYNNSYSKNFIKVDVQFSNSLAEQAKKLLEDSIDETNNYSQCFETTSNLWLCYNGEYNGLDDEGKPIYKDGYPIFDLFKNDKDDCPYNQIYTKINDNGNILLATKEYIETIEFILSQLEDLHNAVENVKVPSSSSYMEDYNALKSNINNKISNAHKEEDYVKNLAICKPDECDDYKNQIKILFATPSEDRYIFTDDEYSNILNHIFTEENKNDNPALEGIEKNCKILNDNIKSSGYVTYFNKIIVNDDNNIPEEINACINEIKGILYNYLSESTDLDERAAREDFPEDLEFENKGKEVWHKILTFDTHGEEELLSYKERFNKLNNQLWAYYYKMIRNKEINIKSYEIILNTINNIDQALNPYKNFDFIEINASYQERWRDYDTSKTNLGKVYEMIKVDSEEDINPNRIIHIKPIIMLLNRYELGYLNEWDGNKLKIDNNGGYILSPALGAGRKEDDNSFTGITMGVYSKLSKLSDTTNLNENADYLSRTGLFGFHKGIQSIFLDAQTGSATFGKPGDGQIYIDAQGQDRSLSQSSALDYSGNNLFSYNYFTGYSVTGQPKYNTHDLKTGKGMLINLKNGFIHFGAQSIAKLCSGAHLDHNSIANGFCLDPHGLSIGAYVKIDEDGTFFFGTKVDGDKFISFEPNNNKFVVGKDVEVTASSITADALNSAQINLTNTEGFIKGPGFILNKTGLEITTGNINITQGSITLGLDQETKKYKFTVDNSGNLSAKGANISGTLTAGTNSRIGNWWIGDFVETAYGKATTFRGCLVGRAGEGNSEDKIRLYPGIGTIGFKDNGNPSGFAYLQANSAANTLYIKSKIDPDDGSAFGDLVCRNIFNDYIICDRVVINDEINLLDTKNTLINRINADGTRLKFYNLSGAAPTSKDDPLGTITLTKSGIYKYKEVDNEKKWVLVVAF